MTLTGILVAELAVIALILGVFVYFVYRAMRPKNGQWAVPVRDVDARKRAEQLERRLLDLERDVLVGEAKEQQRKKSGDE